ncbi:MAG: hypothetical protein RR550_00705 [Rikenellaceae bacterium]
MKKKDLLLLLLLAVIFVPFFVSEELFTFYKEFNSAHYYIMAFLKFAILATIGESIGLRIKNGVYNESGFGLFPRSVVWGLLGIWIASAMKIFSVGVPVLLESYGVEGVCAAMAESFSGLKLLGAFCISVFMNTAFGPVFMTIHKVTDTHILRCGGGLSAFTTPIAFGDILSSLNWKVQWGFVFKKTIPFFWFPAHTITFMLPSAMQVLFAAFLGVALGILLSIAAVKGRK